MSDLPKIVKEIIFNHNSGWVFTYVDFNGLGNMVTVGKILSKLAVSGEIKRIRKGIYYIPENSRWGEVSPSPSNIIKALARSMNTDFIPDGANALYQLGLTHQVPMKQIYLTDKQINTITIGKVNIEFRKVSPKKLSGAENSAGIYLSAIEYLGKEEAERESMKLQVAATLNEDSMIELKYASKNRSAWVRKIVDDILNMPYSKASSRIDRDNKFIY